MPSLRAHIDASNTPPSKVTSAMTEAARQRRSVPGIFCVEGSWTPRLTDKQSVKPLLEFLETSGKVKYAYQPAKNRDTFLDVVRKWPQQQYRRYSVGWLASHGGPGYLYVGRRQITLGELGEELRGACAGKLIYFGGCEILNIPGGEISAFRKQTRARCVAGYVNDADWYPVAAFELLLMEALTWYHRSDAVQRWLTDEYPDLVRKLGFTMHYGSA